MKRILTTILCLVAVLPLLAAKKAAAPVADKNVYLDLMQCAIEAYTPEHIAKYMHDTDSLGIFEHGYARLTSDLGILIAHGRMTEFKDTFEQMMDICVRELPIARDKNRPKGGEIGNDFAVKEVVGCILEVEAAGIFPKEKTDAWRAALKDMKADDIYSQRPPVGKKTAHNWSVFASAGECARVMAGIGGDRSYADKYLTDQLRFFDENGMYMDPKQPMVYDLGVRLQFMIALSFGYDGPAKAAIEEQLLKSAFVTLQLQSACGEIPYGGRSNQFLHNEAFLAAACEYYATWMKQRGDMEAASRFKAAACRAAESEKYWTSQLPLRHVKNRFPTETKFGCEHYAHFNKYMATMASWAYMAYRFADDSIQPASVPEPASTFVTSDPFHRIMMNAGGYTVQFDWNAQPEYDSNGIGRFQKTGAPPILALATSCPQVPDPPYTIDVPNEGPLAIAPVWDKYEVVSAKTGEVVMTNGADTWTTRLSKRGLLMTVKSQGGIDFTIPTLYFDGESEIPVVCKGKKIIIEFRGWRCTYKANTNFVASDKNYRTRNGFIRRYDAIADRSIRIKGKIEKI